MFRCRVFCRSRIQTGTERGTQWAERARSRLTMCRKGKESSQGGSSVLCRKYRNANGGELVNVHCQWVRLNCASVKHDQCYTKHIDKVYVHLLRNHFVGKWQYIMQSAVQKYGNVYIGNENDNCNSFFHIFVTSAVFLFKCVSKSLCPCSLLFPATRESVLLISKVRPSINGWKFHLRHSFVWCVFFIYLFHSILSCLCLSAIEARTSCVLYLNQLFQKEEGIMRPICK